MSQPPSDEAKPDATTEPEPQPAPAPSEAAPDALPVKEDAESAAADSAEDPSPRKRKKKKRKPAEDAASAPEVFERPARDAKGNERPAFLLRFPVDSELEPLIAAFEVGNYAAVRTGADSLAQNAERPEVRRAAEELLRRIEPDPVVKLFLGVAVALLLIIVAYAYKSGS